MGSMCFHLLSLNSKPPSPFHSFSLCFVTGTTGTFTLHFLFASPLCYYLPLGELERLETWENCLIAVYVNVTWVTDSFCLGSSSSFVPAHLAYIYSITPRSNSIVSPRDTSTAIKHPSYLQRSESPQKVFESSTNSRGFSGRLALPSSQRLKS